VKHAKTAAARVPRRDGLTIAGLLFVIAVAYVGYHLLAMNSSAPEDAEMVHHDMSEGGMDAAMAALGNLPEDHETLVQMGNSFMDQGSFAVAAEIYKRALALKDVPDVRVDYGACLHAMGLPLRAIEEFQRTIPNMVSLRSISASSTCRNNNLIRLDPISTNTWNWNRTDGPLRPRERASRS
jgi:hypothetical protein